MARWTIALLTALLAVTVAASGPNSIAAAPGGEASVAKKKKCKKGKKGKKGAAQAKKCKRKKKPTVALPPASITLNPTTYFPQESQFTTDEEVFTVTNAGGTGATGPIAATISGTGSAKYSISENVCAGLALPGGQSCTFKVTFAPGTGLGNFSATLTVSATPGGSPTAAFSGTSSP